MTERESMFAGVAKHPEQFPVLADWLEEHGEPELAAKIRGSGGYWSGSGMEPIRGLLIREVYRSDDELVFVIDAGAISFLVEGDCCSESWYHLIEGVENLIGASVVAIFEADVRDVDENDGRGRQESESIYGIGLLTTKGVSRIVFRNSSNGYYGGWIKFIDEANIAGHERVTQDWISPVPVPQSS